MSAGFFQALSLADDRLAELESLRAQIAAAVGFYTCPCGSEFELFEGAGLEDYASLNRWLGRHVNGCPDVELAEAIDREVGLYRAVEIDELRAEHESLKAECARLRAEVASLTSMCTVQSLELTNLRLQRDRRGW